MRRHKLSLESSQSFVSGSSSKSRKSSSKSERSSKSSRSEHPSKLDLPLSEFCILDASAPRVPWLETNSTQDDDYGLPPFSYDGLEVDRTYVRLFHIEITTYRQAIGMLHCFPVDNLPAYHALSYTWGADSVNSTIQINNAAFNISEDLLLFLELYAAQHPNEYIWIDQIAINQLDIDERNEQVRLMSRIYRGAKEVLIWIRPAPALDCRIADQNDHWHGADDGPWECDRLMDLLTNDYWTRVWVLQEILLGRVRRIFYGHAVLKWTDLHYFVDGNMSPRRQSIPYIRPGLHDPEAASRMIAIPTQLIWLLQHPPTSRFVPLDFADILKNCCQSKSKDPRDKVYGLQGLLHRSQHVRIDYRSSVKEVFIEAAVVYAVCGESSGPLLELARTMGMAHRSGSNGGPLLNLIAEVITWTEDYGETSTSKDGLRAMLRRYLAGPALPHTRSYPFDAQS